MPGLRAQTPVMLLKMVSRLAQQVRSKTTSEHVMKLRGGESKVFVPKTQNQIALENKSHMSFMPVPEGSWEENYGARNMKCTQMLVVAALFMGFSTYCMYATDCFFMHDLPPRRTLLPDSEKIGKL